MKLLLRRESPQPDHDCTLGLLFVEGLSLVTIERPWIEAPLDSVTGLRPAKGGAHGISCVPTGTYRLVRHDTEAHPRTWALVNEELDVVHLPSDSANPLARSAVLIHPANFASQLLGCIAPGTRAMRDPAGVYMVQDSRKAMKMLQDVVPWVDDSHTLEIT